MIYSIRHLPEVIRIGVQTESGVEAIGFDLRPWLDMYDGIDVTIWPTRPGESAAYRVADKNMELVGTVLYWYPDLPDTSIAGCGTVELLGITGDKRKLSGVCKTEILPTSLGGTQEAPEAARPWVEEVLDAADEAKKQADRAEEIADRLVGAEAPGVVRYDREQTLTEAEKALARQNIGAGTGGEVTTDKTLTQENAAADAKATGDRFAELSEEIAKLPTGGGAAIVDVTVLPETDIREDVFYRELVPTFIFNKQYRAGWPCYPVDALPETGIPAIQGSLADLTTIIVTAYYLLADGGVYGYVNAALSSVFGVPAGWYPAAALFNAAGWKYAGVIRNIEDDPEDDQNRVLLRYILHSVKDSEWQSLDVIGWRGTGAQAEVFNKYTNVASGNYSHAEGYNTTASGASSHAEGDNTTASGGGSHAEGDNTTASGYVSHAEGSETTASGNVSHAEGSSTTASGETSHAEGIFTIAARRGQHVQGRFNVEDTSTPDEVRYGKYAHIVGNGTSDSDRSNAHTLDWDGNAWFAGGIELTSPNGTRYRFTVSDDGTLTATVVTE